MPINNVHCHKNYRFQTVSTPIAQDPISSSTNCVLSVALKSIIYNLAGVLRQSGQSTHTGHSDSMQSEGSVFQFLSTDTMQQCNVFQLQLCALRWHATLSLLIQVALHQARISYGELS